jgi:hypothetical protein
VLGSRSHGEPVDEAYIALAYGPSAADALQRYSDERRMGAETHGSARKDAA